MRILVFLVSAVTLLLGNTFHVHAQEDFRSKTLIVKVKEEYRQNCTQNSIDLTQLNDLKSALGASQIWQKFPYSSRPSLNARAAAIPQIQDKQVDISLIYEWNYSNELDVLKAQRMALASGVFEYVEPAFIYELAYVPSDSLAAKQYHLAHIKAYEAFDIDSGSADITIGVIDTGIDWDHPDLEDAIQYNEEDLFDGIDNDGNGYVDDFRGWNFYDGNNDPMETSWSHGTHVSGLAAATTNNKIGVVGTGFKCKVLPVKGGHQLQMTHAYEGVIYAVDNGADVVNCSWGGSTPSQFGYDVIKYATYNKDALVLGAAGNANRQEKFFPASYDEVLSVGATDSLYHKADFSNYNYYIDLVAPGRYILSTKNNTYDLDNGTSMACPIVAGAAGIVRHKFPELSAMQVLAHMVKMADDSIYSIPFNQQYQDKLGSGLLDMRASLNDPSGSFVRLENLLTTDYDDETYNVGDQVFVGFELVNYLESTSSVVVTLQSVDTFNNIQIVDSIWQVGSLASGERLNNFGAPFSFNVIDNNGPYNQTVTFRVKISESGAISYDYFDVTLKPDYVNVTVNNVASTVSSNGLVGYTNYNHSNGLGFEYLNLGNFLYEGGLMIGIKDEVREKVVDKVRGRSGGDNDFTTQNVIFRANPNGAEAFYAQGSFVDTSAILDEIGLEVHQTVKAFDEEGKRNYILLTYDLINKSGEDLEDVYVGMFADWDISNAIENKASTVYANKLGYVYSSSGSDYAAGVQVLTEGLFHSYMIDNTIDGSGGINMYDEDGYTSAEKYISLSTNRFEAGGDETGNDVIQVIASDGSFIGKGDTLSVTFAIHGGSSVEDLISSSISAYEDYFGYKPGENLEGEVAVSSLYPVPAVDVLTLDFDLKSAQEITFSIIDLKGTIINQTEGNGFFAGSNRHEMNVSDLRAGVYFLNIQSDLINETISFEKLNQ